MTAAPRTFSTEEQLVLASLLKRGGQSRRRLASEVPDVDLLDAAINTLLREGIVAFIGERVGLTEIGLKVAMIWQEVYRAIKERDED